MIVSLILLILVVVFLAFFIGSNISNSCTFWFFKTYTNVPVVTLVFIAFAAGVIIALLVILIAKLKTSSSDGKIPVKSKNKEIKDEIKNLKEKNKKSIFQKKKSAQKEEKNQTTKNADTLEKKNNE